MLNEDLSSAYALPKFKGYGTIQLMASKEIRNLVSKYVPKTHVGRKIFKCAVVHAVATTDLYRSAVSIAYRCEDVEYMDDSGLMMLGQAVDGPAII